MKKFQDVVKEIAEIDGSPHRKVMTRLYSRVMSNGWPTEMRMEVIRPDGKRGKVLYLSDTVADALVMEAHAQTILRGTQK